MSIPCEFWTEYDRVDALKREEHIKHLVDNVIRIGESKELDANVKRHVMTMTLMGYFDDLIEYGVFGKYD